MPTSINKMTISDFYGIEVKFESNIRAYFYLQIVTITVNVGFKS